MSCCKSRSCFPQARRRLQPASATSSPTSRPIIGPASQTSASSSSTGAQGSRCRGGRAALDAAHTPSCGRSWTPSATGRTLPAAPGAGQSLNCLDDWFSGILSGMNCCMLPGDADPKKSKSPGAPARAAEDRRPAGRFCREPGRSCRGASADACCAGGCRGCVGEESGVRFRSGAVRAASGLPSGRVPVSRAAAATALGSSAGPESTTSIGLGACQSRWRGSREGHDSIIARYVGWATTHAPENNKPARGSHRAGAETRLCLTAAAPPSESD